MDVDVVEIDAPSISESGEDQEIEEELRLFCEQVDAEQARRDKELFEFLQELVDSNEEGRKKKEVKDVSTQVLPNYLEKYAKETKDVLAEIVDDYRLTRYFQTKFVESRRKESREKCDENRRIRARQDEAVAVIKDHILEAGQAHACHLKERIEHRLTKIEKALGGYPFRPEFKRMATEHVLSFKRIKRNQTIGRKQREISIVNKLLNERKRWRQIEAIRNKTYDYVVRPKKKPEIAEEVSESYVSGASVGGEIEEEEEVPPLEEFVIGLEDTVEKPRKEKKEKKKKKKGKDKKDKKGKKGSEKGKKSKKGDEKKKKDKKGKKEKKGKKDKKKKKAQLQPDLVLPEIPVINPRKKITCGDPEAMGDILQQHEELLMVVNEKKYFDSIVDDKEYLYERDTTCFWKPNPVLFQNFENGKIYKKKVTIINGGKLTKKIRLYAALIDDGFDPYLINVDTFGIAVVMPGLSFSLALTFRPRKLNQVTYGKLIFTISETNRDWYTQFSVPIKCVPYIGEIFITPMHVRFGTVPFWRVKDLKPKSLRVISTNSKSYHVKIKKILEESQLREISQILQSPTAEFVGRMLEELGDICHHKFKFSGYAWELPPVSGFDAEVVPTRLSRIGSYWERFECQFFQRDESESRYVGCQECMVSAEVTDHFLKISPDVLDLGVCTFGSVYQEKFELRNGDLGTHRVLLRFPSSIRYYLSSNAAEIIVSSNETREISLKFMPREDITDGFLNCYDPDTKILKFPIKAEVATKGYEDVPPVKLTVFAVLAESSGLTVRPLSLEFAKRNGNDFLLDMGGCSVREAVYAKLGVTNATGTRQHFGFLDLPNCVSISPDYGFGFLDPYESKELKLFLVPEREDVSNTEEGQDSFLTFRISVTTLKQLGALKKTLNYKKIRRSYQYILDVLKNECLNPLEKEMSDCVQLLRNSDQLLHLRHSIVVEETEDDLKLEAALMTGEDETGPRPDSERTEQLNQIDSNKIWLRAYVRDPPVSLSHQLVIFPDTPCGSYSTTRLRLKTQKYLVDARCLCGFKPPEQQKYEIHFEISSDNSAINVEPICGDLLSGNSIDLHLVARPAVPAEVVEEKARYLKEMEIVEEKRRQILAKREQDRQARLLREEMSREKNKKKKKKKEKEKKKGGKKQTKTTQEEVEAQQSEPEAEPLPEITVDPKEVHVTYFDLYPAEMVIWRDFQPQQIEANFVLEISYGGENVVKEPDFLYLRAMCRVTSPSFIHNLDRQHLHFGPTAIGSSKRKILELRNVQDVDIRPRISFLSPLGGFSCPNVADVSLPSEHILRVPITFKPSDDLECHVCHGTNDQMSCYNDPKSMQWLSCDEYGTCQLINAFMITSNVTVPCTTNFTCVYLTYDNELKHIREKEQIVVRSCLATNEEMCPTFEWAVREVLGMKFRKCRQCAFDYCNAAAERMAVGALVSAVTLAVLRTFIDRLI